MKHPKQSSQQKEPRDVRYRNQHFPNFDQLVFDKSKKGFVPLPIIMRKAMRYLSAVELRVLVYLQTRASQYGICYPTLEEMAHDLDLKGTRNLSPHVKALEKKKFISTASSGGRKLFLVHDPVVGIKHLASTGSISAKELFEINELLGDLGRDSIVVQKNQASNIASISQAKSA